MSGRVLLAALLPLLLFGVAWGEHVDLGTIAEDVEVTVLESNDSHTLVRFDVGGFDLNAIDIEGNTYYQLSCAKEGVLMNAGEPALPRFCRSIIIPDDARVEARVVSSKYVDFPAKPIAPSKGNLPRTVNPADVPYEFGEVYQEVGFYPGVLADVRAPYILRDYRGTVIELNAFQYNPGSKTLRVFSSVTVEVVTTGQGEINVLENRELPIRLVGDFDQIYRSRFINYHLVGSRYESVSEIGDMLVITYDDFAAAMEPFVDWKLQKGINTTMVTRTQAGGTASGIAAFIQGFYDTTDLAFVLLVGDAAQIPTLSASGGSSDPSYVKLEGGDDYPDAFIGRFSAENVAQVETQVERTITYERDLAGSGWFHMGTGIASSQGAGIGHNGGEADNVHMDKIRDSLLSFTYTLVDQIYDPSGTAAQVTAALNAGRTIVNYCGHGSTTAWSSTGFSNSHVDALVNDNLLPFIVSVACVNGQFAGYTCFGEAWLRATNGSAPTGAIGAYMSSVNQSWAPPMDAQDEVVHLLINEVKTSYGGLCFNGSCKMIDINGADGVEMYDTWHIFGDPSVQVRTDDPAPMMVTHDGAVFFQSPTYSVNVAGVEGALCALYADGILYGSGYTDFAGNAIIDIVEPLPITGTVDLTITAFNKQTYIDDVQVTSDLAIVHQPLADTKDTLNDYTVLCQIYSNTPLIPDSLKLFYQINSVWTTVMLRDTLAEEDYVAEIPAQAPGTVINYYLFAANEGGYLDTTETFTFRVIDYAVVLEPTYMWQTAPTGDTAWYDLTVTNDGVLADDYSLSAASVWDASFWDETGSTEISSTGTLYLEESFNFKLAVLVPEDAVYGASDSAAVFVQSNGNPLIYAEAAAVTYSAGTPLDLPFVENFLTTEIDTVKWDIAEDVDINDVGLNEPTEPYSANLNADPDGGDLLVSQAIDLGGESGVNISYYYQQTGGGESADDGDDLFCEYLNDQGQWVQLAQHLGAEPDMDQYALFSTGVPADGYHSLFQIRFSNVGSAGPYDDWFIDDIRIDYGPSISATPTSFSLLVPLGDSTEETLTISNGGPGSLTYTLSVTPDFSRMPAFERLYQLGEVNPASYDLPDGWEPIELAKGVDDAEAGPEVRFNAGGPDQFGYIWVDSDEPGGPTFAWVDILATGTDVTSQLSDDNFIGPFPVGFDFPYYDGVYNQFYIAANGMIGFGPTTGLGAYSNVPIPSTGTPNNMICWCWDDLNVTHGDGSGKVLYETVGDNLVIEFYHYAEYDVNGLGDMITAQVILAPDGGIKLQYLEIEAGFIIDESTIGIENLDGTDGLQVAHNTSYLHENLAVEISKPAEWLFPSQFSGDLAAGEFDLITLAFSTAQTDTGLYKANINIASNDPDPEDNPLIVPVEMTVTGDMPPLPDVPDMLTPADSAIIDTETPEFSWTETAGVGGTYTLEYSQDETFESGEVIVTGISETSFTPEDPLVDGVWFWHVQAVNIAGGSGYQENPDCFMVVTYLTGDVNADQLLNVSDAVYLLRYIFSGGPAPEPLACGDCDCDGNVNVTDATYMITFIFGGGPAPCTPQW